MEARSACDTGDIGEVILMAELVMRGHSVAIPWGHNNAFDLIVVTKSSKTLKLQIKTSHGRGNGRFQFSGVKNLDKNDMFGFLLLDRWHFIKSNELKKLVRPNGMLHLHKSKVKLDNFEVFC